MLTPLTESVSKTRHHAMLAILTFLLLTSTVAGVGTADAATPVETMALWHVQVRITTASIAGAGTDGTPAIRFNTTSTGVRSLNPPSKTAFDAGRVDSTDVRLFRSPQEITMLRVGVTGTDDWCIKRVELWLNDRVAFARDTVPGGGCASIRDGTYVEYSSAALRSNPAWRNYGFPPQQPNRLSASSLGKLVTDVTGAAMVSSSSVHWNPAAPLTISRRDSSTIRISYGVWVSDPSGGDSTFRAQITYDARLFSGMDGTLHARKVNASCCYHQTMSSAVITQLDQALSRMTVRTAPHDPLRFGVDAATNIIWSFIPVVG